MAIDALARLRADNRALVRFDLDEGQCLVRGAYCRGDPQRDVDAAFFAQLRRAQVGQFFDDATPDTEEVLRWVGSYYDADLTQANFVIQSVDGARLGFFGLSRIDLAVRTADFGRVMKHPDAFPGLMQAALQAALPVLADRLGLLRLTLEVFSDNDAAVQLYRKLGFQTSGSAYRHTVRRGGRRTWIRGDATAPDARETLCMTLVMGPNPNPDGSFA